MPTNRKTPNEPTYVEETVKFVSASDLHDDEVPPSDDPHISEFKEIAAINWDDNREVVRSYIDDLLRIDDKDQARELLDRALSNGAPFTQRLACEALGKLGEPGIRVL